MIVAQYIIIIAGFILLFLTFWLPYKIHRMRNHGGGYFTPGYESLQQALRFLVPAFSVLAGMAGIYIGLPFVEKRTISVILGVITLLIFCGGLILSVYSLLIRPLSGTAPLTNHLFWIFRLLLLGLSFVMFTLSQAI